MTTFEHDDDAILHTIQQRDAAAFAEAREELRQENPLLAAAWDAADAAGVTLRLAAQSGDERLIEIATGVADAAARAISEIENAQSAARLAAAEEASRAAGEPTLRERVFGRSRQ